MSVEEPLLHELVASDDHLQFVRLQELLSTLAAEVVSRSSRRHIPVLCPLQSPTVFVLVRVGVGPKEVAESTVMRDVAGSLEFVDFLNVVEVRRKATVAAELLAVTRAYFLVHNSGQRKKLVELSEHFPNTGRAIGGEALIVEAKRPVDLSALVVASEEPNLAGIACLERQQQCEDPN
jgi:hypothetical protein